MRERRRTGPSGGVAAHSRTWIHRLKLWAALLPEPGEAALTQAQRVHPIVAQVTTNTQLSYTLTAHQCPRCDELVSVRPLFIL